MSQLALLSLQLACGQHGPVHCRLQLWLLLLFVLQGLVLLVLVLQLREPCPAAGQAAGPALGSSC